MIIGDPSQFAIWFDEVRSWSTQTISNGCLAYIAQEEIVPRLPFSSTIGADIVSMSHFQCLTRAIGDGRVAEMSKEDAFSILYSRAFPNEESADENDFSHLVSPYSFRDAGHIFFLSQGREEDRILFGPHGEPGEVKELRRSEEHTSELQSH